MNSKFILRTILAALLVFVTVAAVAQDSTMLRKHPPKDRIIDRIFTGGNLGAQFGTITFFEVSPLVGYKFTDKIAAGVGVTYQYYHYNDQLYDFETSVYGGRVFGRYMFNSYLFGYAEYEYLNLEAFDFQTRRVDVESLLGGGGYMQPLGEHASLVAMILYNFTESVYTPYSNPIIRVGINVGF